MQHFCQVGGSSHCSIDTALAVFGNNASLFKGVRELVILRQRRICFHFQVCFGSGYTSLIKCCVHRVRPPILFLWIYKCIPSVNLIISLKEEENVTIKMQVNSRLVSNKADHFST